MRTCALYVIAAGVLASCTAAEAPDDELNPVGSPAIPQVASAEEALTGAHIPTLDPHTMNDAEVSLTLGAGPYCAFRYTSAGRPVLAISPAQTGNRKAGGVVKLNGKLVPLERQDEGNGPIVLGAGNIQLTLMLTGAAQPTGAVGSPPAEADVLFEIGKELRVGYSGYYTCPAARS